MKLAGLIFIFWLAGVRSAFGDASYHVGGVFHHTNFTEVGGIASTLHYPFTVHVDGGKVAIRVFAGNETFTSWSFDGTNSYYMIDSTNVAPKLGKLNAAVTLHEREFPYSCSPIERSIWLGLASGYYFSRTNSEPLLVPWLDWGFPGTLSFDWRMRRSEQSPFLPVEITFVATKRLWEKEQGIKIGNIGKWPFRDGQIAGLFKVSGFLTNAGLVLPSAFEVVRYFNEPDVADQVLAISVVRVTQFNVSPTTTGGFVPKITRATDVSDMRSETPEMPRFGITYTLTNDSWLAKSDPVRLALIESNKTVYAEWRRALAAKERAGQPRSNILTRVFLVLSVSGPVALYCILRIKKKGKQ